MTAVSAMSFNFEILQSEDLITTNNFLIENFFSREPLGLKLGIQPERDVSEWLSEVTQPLLDQQVKYRRLNIETFGLKLDYIWYYLNLAHFLIVQPSDPIQT